MTYIFDWKMPFGTTLGSMMNEFRSDEPKFLSQYSQEQIDEIENSLRTVKKYIKQKSRLDAEHQDDLRGGSMVGTSANHTVDKGGVRIPDHEKIRNDLIKISSRRSSYHTNSS